MTAYTPSTAPVPDTEVIVERGSTARDLGPKLNRSAGDVIRFLLLQGEMVTATQSLTDDMIELFAAELGAEVRLVDPGEEREAELLAKFFDEDDEEEARRICAPVRPWSRSWATSTTARPCCWTGSGRPTWWPARPVGSPSTSGPTRSTGTATPSPSSTPPATRRSPPCGPVAPTSPTSSVLVVAADDGVMPQTVEAIDHAKAADVPIIVAVNKIDREEADPNRVLQQLSEHGLVPEAWGGDTIAVEISALQNLGIDDLLEQIILVAEVEELVATPEGRARGVVLEAELEIGRGPVASVIVERGTLRVGDAIVAGAAWGKVKALVDDNGRPDQGGPALHAGPGARVLGAARGRGRVQGGPRAGPGPDHG